MSVKHILRLTGEQHSELHTHLFPGDNKEAVALLLCGRREGIERHVFTVRKVIPIPHDQCSVRTRDQVTWPTQWIDTLVKESYAKRQAIVKIHSHPTGYNRFSDIDDDSDSEVFGAVSSLLDDGLPHASLIMLRSGEIFGRVILHDGAFENLTCVTVTGDDIKYWKNVSGASSPTSLRDVQAFGRGTINKLRELSIAVIGCSGTGSIVVEQLARLGVGRLVLVDHDIVEEKNLNRILNSGKEDAYLRRSKVDVLAKAIARMGFGQEVVPVASNIANSTATKLVAECDAVFGCMDGVEGRHFLNRLCTFYLLPYIDVGVKLEADGHGGISNIAGAVHYLQPGRSTLMSRGVYTMKQVEAEELYRTDPERYAALRRDGYIHGIVENRPAVISVNMLFASLAVNEFLARLHPYRNNPNTEFAYVGASLAEMYIITEQEAAPDRILSKHVGRGDVVPLLERSFLS